MIAFYRSHCTVRGGELTSDLLDTPAVSAPEAKCLNILKAFPVKIHQTDDTQCIHRAPQRNGQRKGDGDRCVKREKGGFPSPSGNCYRR